MNQVLVDSLVRLLTDGFIVSLLLWMIFWDSEPHNPIRKHWIPKVQWLFVWLGLNAEWKMFSPDPPRIAIWPMAKLTMENRDVVYWEPTPFDKLTALEKVKFKKSHKYFQRVVLPESGVQIKQDFIEYLLRRYLHGEPLIRVEVYRVAQSTEPFGAQDAGRPKPTKELVYTFRPAATGGLP